MILGGQIHHTPFDGSGKMFTIGLSLLDPGKWLETNDQLAHQLAEKQRLERSHPKLVWADIDGSLAGQQECFEMVVDHLKTRHADTHAFEGQTVMAAGLAFDFAEADILPLKRAARMIQEDLLLLDRKPDGWTLVAASLSFPSSWSLLDKIGKPMHLIHQPVPDFGPDTRNAEMIGRIFDRLPVESPVKRMNWSINNTPALFLPGHSAGKDPHLDLDDVHIRVERQTLRKMPETDMIIFSIGIQISSLAAIMALPEAPGFAETFAAQIRELSADQVAYKGFASRQAALAERILELAGLGDTPLL